MSVFEFTTGIIEWRGPAPFFFAPLTPDVSEGVKSLARAASYGWGVVPVEAEIGATVFRTSLFPRDNGYLLPIKSIVRKAERISVGDEISVRMAVTFPHPE